MNKKERLLKGVFLKIYCEAKEKVRPIHSILMIGDRRNVDENNFLTTLYAEGYTKALHYMNHFRKIIHVKI